MSCIVSNLLTAWESAEVAMLNKPGGGRVTSLGARRNPIGVRDRCGQAASDSPPNRQCFSIGDVRGAGLFVGTEFVGAGKAPHPAEALRVVNAMRECGVLISATGYSGNTI